MPEQKFLTSMEDTSFPRGGGRTSNSDSVEAESAKLKRKSPADSSVETDFLFGRKDEVKSSKTTKKRRKSSNSVQSMLPLGGGGVVIPTSSSNKKVSVPVIEALGFNKLAKHTKVLAIVREVQNEFAVASLPNLLTAYILPSDSIHPLPHCLKVGQTLAVVVLKVVTENVKGQTATRKRIQVTAQPRAVNVRDKAMFEKKNLPVRGQITSVEDHGCLVDLGLGRKGFLKFDDVDGDYTILDGNEDGIESNTGQILQPGRLLDFFIASPSNSSKAQVYSLTLPSKKSLVNNIISQPGSSKSDPYTLASIMPGWMVTTKVEALAKNGLCVTFLGNVFRGAIEMNHLGGYSVPKSKEEDGWKHLFQKHQHFQARVIAVDIPTKLIRLSLLPHLMELKSPPSLPSVGTIVKDCTVVKVDPGIGALLAMPDAYSGHSMELSKKMVKSSELFQNEDFQEASRVRAVYVHISKALDGEKNANSASIFGKEFAPSTKHTVRILSCGNWVDGIASGACAPSILDAHVLTHSDLKAGQVYKQVPVVAQLQGGSVLVQLGGNTIRALIPSDHLVDSSRVNSEYRKKVLKAKFAVDSKVDVRLLWVDSRRKKCMATAKKALVKAPDSEILSSFETVKLGDKITGYVSQIDEKAMYVTFCNRVYGKVTARSLATELGMENIHDNYAVGDVVTCRVVKLRKRSKRRSSLLIAGEEEESENEDEKPAYFELTLSMKINVEGDDLDFETLHAKSPKQVHLQAGAILPMKSMKIAELVKGKEKANGSFVPGYAIVSIKSKHLLDGSEYGHMPSTMECKLPYDQILDEYSPERIESAAALDALGEKVLTIGKKINQTGILLTFPNKTNIDYSNGIGRLPVVSLRKKLIQTAERQYSISDSSPEEIIIPSPQSKLFVGAILQGYVAQIDSRYGAFIRFLDGLTGMIMKKQGGLDMPLFETIITRVRAIDNTKGHLLLEAVNLPLSNNHLREKEPALPVKVGDKVSAKIKDVNFFELSVAILEGDTELEGVHGTVHITLKSSLQANVKCQEKSILKSNKFKKMTKNHPFYGLKAGQTLASLHVVSVIRQKRKVIAHLTDRPADTILSNKSDILPGAKVSVIVTGVAPNNKGLYVEASPSLKGFIPGLELSKDMELLNNIEAHVAIGSRIGCVVVDQTLFHGNRGKNRSSDATEKSPLIFSVVGCDTDEVSIPQKPVRGDLVLGRIQRGLPQSNSPALMVALRGGFVGRCCITELEESDEWENMPTGRISTTEDGQNMEQDSMQIDKEDADTNINEE